MPLQSSYHAKYDLLYDWHKQCFDSSRILIYSKYSAIFIPSTSEFIEIGSVK